MKQIPGRLRRSAAIVALGWFPLIVSANNAIGSGTDRATFDAFANLSSNEFLSMEPLDDAELQTIEGTFRGFDLSLILAPQINICLFCNDVSQVNQAMIFTLFQRP